MIRFIFLMLCIILTNVSYAQSWENYIKHFPRKSSTVVRDYKGNILKKHSLGVLNVRINFVQQCADAAIRLRAEYFYSKKEYDKIKFKLTNGVEVSYVKWVKYGYRLINKNNKVVFEQPHFAVRGSYTRNSFEEYLKAVMYYAGSASLFRDLKSANRLPKIGDLLIIPGYPGHVVIVIDKKRINNINYYLFANSWIPAQDIEIINGYNPKKTNIGIYTPIVSTNDKIKINGYDFTIKKHLRTW